MTTLPEVTARKAGSGRVESLLESMTLEEKVGQMTQLTVGALAADDSPRRDTLRLDPARLHRAVAERHVGSIINVLHGSLTVDGWCRLLEEIQEAADGTRLGIPILYGIDHVHGANYVVGGTILPHTLVLAATFEAGLVRRAAEVTARETAAAGLPWTFAPVLDAGRQPLWPRFYETFGESTWLTGELGEAMVRGFQGEGVAATGKHFLAYSGPAGGRDRTPALLGRRAVHEQFLPPFRRAIDAGVAALMVNSGEIDGEPVHSSRYWLDDVLRRRLGFKGVVVTDWADITFLHTRHRVAPSLKDATRMAVQAGIDLAMTPDNFDFHDRLVELVREGSIAEARVDESVRRILGLKEALGLFDRPLARTDTGGRKRHRALALDAARASMTLLKNDGVLPLAPGARVLVTGPGAHSLSALNGGWTHTWQGADPGSYEPGATTVLQEIAKRADVVRHEEGCGFEREGNIGAAAAAAQRSDVAVVVVGEDAYSEWAGDVRDLSLSGPQRRLALAVMSTGTPTILVLLQGRPRIIRDLADGTAAILMAYWPGMQGSRAIAEVLYGEVNPSGRLPFTYPKHPNALTPHDHKTTETLDTRLEPRGPGGFDPQFELGTGLSYTTFEYDELRLASPVIDPSGRQRVEVRVRNTGSRPGRHSVLLFTRQHFSRWTPHVRRLRGARQVTLEPGGAADVSFALVAEDLAAVRDDGERIVEAGAYDVMVGDLKATFRIRSTA
ncbi:MAG: glycoside hydrolase family 3 N-terminal domain-containing protein [Gemmatimonadota bacterium]